MRVRIVFLAAILSTVAVDATAQIVIDSGSCGAQGNNLTWVFHNNGTLTINGSGAMANYKYREDGLSFGWDIPCPWWSYSNYMIENIIIGDSVTSIGDWAFFGCYTVQSVVIPNSVKTIGKSAFESCRSVTYISIQDSSVLSIGDRAFGGCTSLVNVRIPNGVVSIGNYAFAYCENLRTVFIGNSVRTIGILVFDYCLNLRIIYLDPWNTTYSAVYSILFNKAKTILIFYSIGMTETTYTIPNSVTNIESYAFCRCNRLTSVTLGDSVLYIGYNAFTECNNVTSLTVHALTPPMLGYEPFSNVPNTIPIYVPCESILAYQTAKGWSNFSNYIGFMDTTFIFDTVCHATVYNENGFSIPAVAGVYYLTIPSVYGCDSIICLTLAELTTYSNAICQGEIYADNNFTNLTQAGTYYKTLQNVYGCDSIIEFTLIVNPIYVMQIRDSICDGNSYNFFDKWLTTNGVYYDTLESIYDCDSIIELTLTINPTYITKISDSIRPGDSYDFFGKLLTIDGIYSDTLQTIYGCDSIIELRLTVTSVGIVENNYELQITSYEIFDMLGRKFNTPIAPLKGGISTFEEGWGMFENIVDISNLPRGFYIIKFQTNRGIITKKFIK